VTADVGDQLEPVAANLAAILATAVHEIFETNNRPHAATQRAAVPKIIFVASVRRALGVTKRSSVLRHAPGRAAIEKYRQRAVHLVTLSLPYRTSVWESGFADRPVAPAVLRPAAPPCGRLGLMHVEARLRPA
jgi:hypothetical protein